MNDNVQRWTIRGATALMAVLTVAVIVGLVRSQYCQFTWGKMALHDYGIYFNMLWNTAHGDWFTYLADQSYLRTHLSFSLVLLAPLFRLWDDPLLLTVIQWFCLLIGGLLFWRILFLSGVSGLTSSAFLFLFVGYPYTQGAMMCEFHGVHLYYILIPWLYLCLAFRKSWVWLPLLLVAGLREDAVFTMLPMLVYFAVVDRWKTGLAWSIASAAYGIFALTTLFPWINGISITERRDVLLNPDAIKNSLNHQITQRLLCIFRLFLPAMPLCFRRRGWIPVVVFPSLLLIILLSSPERHHYCIHRHYSAGVFTCALLGMIEALRRTRANVVSEPSPVSPSWKLATYFILVTVISHLCWGSLPWGIRNPRKVYCRTSSYIPSMLSVVRSIPAEGILLTDERLAGYLGNRKSVVTFKTIKSYPHSPDYVLFDMAVLNPHRPNSLRPLVENHDMGVIVFEPPFVVMKRGADSARNAEVLAAAGFHAKSDGARP